MKGTYTKHTSLKAGELKSVLEDSGPSVLVTQAVVWVKERDESSLETMGSRLLALWSTLFFFLHRFTSPQFSLDFCVNDGFGPYITLAF